MGRRLAPRGEAVKLLRFGLKATVFALGFAVFLRPRLIPGALLVAGLILWEAIDSRDTDGVQQ